MTAPRGTKTQVKTAAKRSHSSTRWLERQLNDPLVHEAKRLGYRARSVFKLEELDKKFKLLRAGMLVADLGAAPGSWTQYAIAKGCKVVAIDILPMSPVAGATIIEGDFLDPAVQDKVTQALGGPVDMVLSDIAAPATGTRAVDRLRAEAMGEIVLDYAMASLKPGGHCLLKLLKGSEATLVPVAQKQFGGYRLLKPQATRAESSEIYLLATGRRDGAA
ncbi:23S rRNA Um-2552 2'-O-methyltransferase [Arboricoccus pini]|uniref:Ribosomal RNA large subunit methyltransferase E n=1 Tax=Arboricoccus pini TaxID=1963835 RepID=A0A212QRQ7_9PROT|nr:RlmE family RNA methyltransferase [Arboricoccus pini]SNB62135.1 23S rRNA Um-2552 2'-O-methyltransferase [Arboricoccus pini]